MKKKTRNLWLLVVTFTVGLLLAALLLPGGWSAGAEKLAGVTNLEQLYLSAYSTTPVLEVNQTGTGNIVEFQDNGTAVFAVADGGQVSVGTWGQLTAQSVFTVTDGVPLTPTGTYQPLSAAGTVTPSLVVSGTAAGQLLVLENTANQNVVLVDDAAHNLNLTGDVTLGQYDLMTLIWNGADWMEMAVSAN